MIGRHLAMAAALVAVMLPLAATSAAAQQPEEVTIGTGAPMLEVTGQTSQHGPMIVERVHAGLNWAKLNGFKLGRSAKTARGAPGRNAGR